MIMISFCILSKTFFLKREGLSHARVESVTKSEYGFAVYFSKRLLTSLKSISDRRLNEIC